MKLGTEFLASQMITATLFRGTGVFTLADGATRIFSTRGQKLVRRNAIISNRGASAIDILDGTGNVSITIQGATDILLETTDDFSISNRSGGSIEVCVGEFFIDVDVVNAATEVSRAP